MPLDTDMPKINESWLCTVRQATQSKRQMAACPDRPCAGRHLLAVVVPGLLTLASVCSRWYLPVPMTGALQLLAFSSHETRTSCLRPCTHRPRLSRGLTSVTVYLPPSIKLYHSVHEPQNVVWNLANAQLPPRCGRPLHPNYVPGRNRREVAIREAALPQSQQCRHFSVPA